MQDRSCDRERERDGLLQEKNRWTTAYGELQQTIADKMDQAIVSAHEDAQWVEQSTLLKISIDLATVLYDKLDSCLKIDTQKIAFHKQQKLYKEVALHI